MKYRKGDDVRIKPIEWYYSNRDKFGIVKHKNYSIPFIPEMIKFCGKEATVIDIKDGKYTLRADNAEIIWKWCDFMLDDNYYTIRKDKKYECIKECTIKNDKCRFTKGKIYEDFGKNCLIADGGTTLITTNSDFIKNHFKEL